MDPAPSSASSSARPVPATPEDGRGTRRRAVDRARDETVEMLCRRGELSTVPSFEFARRERLSHLAAFSHARYGHVRSVKRLKDPTSTLALVSDISLVEAAVKVWTVGAINEIEEPMLDFFDAIADLSAEDDGSVFDGEPVGIDPILTDSEPDLAHIEVRMKPDATEPVLALGPVRHQEEPIAIEVEGEIEERRRTRWPRVRQTAPSKKTKPMQGEWGCFNPEQCRFATLFAQLEDITEEEVGR